MAVRWYRHLATDRRPPPSRLWDTTSTATPVWTHHHPGDWADTATGWKEQRLPAGTQPLLVAGRQYVLSYTTGATGSHAGKGAYTPAPDAGLTVRRARHHHHRGRLPDERPPRRPTGSTAGPGRAGGPHAGGQRGPAPAQRHGRGPRVAQRGDGADLSLTDGRQPTAWP